MTDKVTFVWVDIETTGLIPTLDDILEIAIVLTNENLKVIDTFNHSVHYSQEDLKESMSDYVREMHTTSGLLTEVTQSIFSVYSGALLEQLALTFLMSHQVPAGSLPMCGNSVHFDRNFLKVHMPDLEKHFHYRNIDISTIAELMKVWSPELTFKKKKAHRALDDIRESIAELDYYKMKGIMSEYTIIPKGD